MAPSPLRGEGWDEGRVLRRPSLAFCIGLVARLLTCGGLSLACRPASYFSLLAQREVAKRNGLWSPPTLQALSVEAFWNRRDTSCSTFGHTAPSPSTEGRRVAISSMVVCRLPPLRAGEGLIRQRGIARTAMGFRGNDGGISRVAMASDRRAGLGFCRCTKRHGRHP